MHMLFFIFLVSSLAAQTWSSAGSLAENRSVHAAVLLPDSRVVVIGGVRSCGNSGCTIASATEIYDPNVNVWTSAPAPASPRFAHAAALLPDGRILVAGGDAEAGTRPVTTEIFDPVSRSWSAGPPVRQGRSNLTATVLRDGRVLLVGGSLLGTGPNQNSDLAELYDAASNQWSAGAAMNVGRTFHSATLLADGRVLVAGGLAGAGRSAEIYDPRANSWTRTGDLLANRLAQGAILLPNGQVLVAGSNTAATNRTCEIFNPANGQWRTAASMAQGRFQPTMSMLPDGRVLVLGGVDAAAQMSAEIYDLAADRWVEAPGPAQARLQHSAVTLPGGRVLITSGANNISSAELFTPAGSLAAVVSAADYNATGRVAAASLVTAFGAGLSNGTRSAPSLPLPTELEGVSIAVRDVSGTERAASLLFVSPSAINFQIPAGTSVGPALVSIRGGGPAPTQALVQVQPISPALFSADGSGRGLPAAGILRVSASGQQTVTAANAQIDFGPAGDQLFVILYGTGLRANSGLASVSLTVGGISCEVLFAGASPEFPGVDQVNARLPRDLAGRGEVALDLRVEGWRANVLRLNFR